MDRRGLMRCRVCDCTQDRGCVVGCGWDSAGVCTVCADLCDLIVLHVGQAADAPGLADIADALHEHLADLEDGDDLRTKRAVFDLLAQGLLRRTDLTYTLTEAGEKHRRAIQRQAQRRAPKPLNGADHQATDAAARTFAFQCSAVEKAAKGRRWRTLEQLVETTGLKAKAVKPAVSELLRTRRIEKHIDGVRVRAVAPRSGA